MRGRPVRNVGQATVPGFAKGISVMRTIHVDLQILFNYILYMDEHELTPDKEKRQNGR
jgi:hypothetical protein